MKVTFLVPLALFAALAGLLYAGLQRNPAAVSSPLVGRPFPAFALPGCSATASGRKIRPRSRACSTCGRAGAQHAGPDQQAVADADSLERHVLVAPVPRPSAA